MTTLSFALATLLAGPAPPDTCAEPESTPLGRLTQMQPESAWKTYSVADPKTARYKARTVFVLPGIALAGIGTGVSIYTFASLGDGEPVSTTEITGLTIGLSSFTLGTTFLAVGLTAASRLGRERRKFYRRWALAPSASLNGESAGVQASWRF